MGVSAPVPDVEGAELVGGFAEGSSSPSDDSAGVVYAGSRGSGTGPPTMIALNRSPVAAALTIEDPGDPVAVECSQTTVRSPYRRGGEAVGGLKGEDPVALLANSLAELDERLQLATGQAR